MPLDAGRPAGWATPVVRLARPRRRSRREYGHLLGTAPFVVRFGRDGTPRRRRNRPRRLLRAAARPRGDGNGGFPGEGPRGVRRALAAAARGRLAREADDRRRRRRGREHRLLGTGRPAAHRLLGRAGVLGPRARDGGARGTGCRDPRAAAPRLGRVEQRRFDPGAGEVRLRRGRAPRRARRALWRGDRGDPLPARLNPRLARDANRSSSPREALGSRPTSTGDRRNQHRYEELLKLLDAIIGDTQNAARFWARDRPKDA